MAVYVKECNNGVKVARVGMGDLLRLKPVLGLDDDSWADFVTQISMYRTKYETIGGLELFWNFNPSTRYLYVVFRPQREVVGIV